MNEQDLLATQFEANRSHLKAVAYRMLGSRSEADDAVQEAWLRLRTADTGELTNLRAWLTTVVGRVCLDILRRRRAQREEPLFDRSTAALETDKVVDPEEEAMVADSVGLALLVVLETLSPAERIAFVLHDTFDLPFEEIAPIVGRSPIAARQLASRARRRVQGAPIPDADPYRRRQVVEAFLTASREGDFTGLLALLDPEVVLHADPKVMLMGRTREVHGRQEVVDLFAGRARDARLALIDGEVGLIWNPRGRTRVVFQFTIQDGKILAIDVIGDRERIAEMEIAAP